MVQSTVGKDELLVKANNLRKAIVKSLYSAITVVKGVVTVPECKELQVVAHIPTDAGFSSRDLSYFKSYYADVRIEAIEAMNFAALKLQQGFQRDGHENPLIKADRDAASKGAAKCAAMVKYIESEEQRRIDDVVNRKERDRIEYEEFLNEQKAEREKNLAAVREREAGKRAAAAERPKLQNITVGTGLDALAAVKTEMRKVGKFTAERRIKKAEAVEIAGGELQLQLLLSDGNGLLEDYRQIVTVKAGAVTRYLLKE